MSLDTVATGFICNIKQQTSKDGKTSYSTFSIRDTQRVRNGKERESRFTSVIVYEPLTKVLSNVTNGDPIAVAGQLEVFIYEGKDGVKPDIKMIANGITLLKPRESREEKESEVVKIEDNSHPFLDFE